MSGVAIVPPIEELGGLPTPLTPGESKVLAFFGDHLPAGWEVYVQPHLNGLRPDFVLLHPRNGIAVYEVKDWDLDAVDYFFYGSPPTLHGHRNGRTFSLASQDPVVKAAAYKKEIHELYCPSLPSKTGFGVITAGVIFPFASHKKVGDLFGPIYKRQFSYEQNPLCSREDLESESLRTVFPLVRRRSDCMSEDIAAELRAWLVEPNASIEQRRPLKLDSRQTGLVTSRTRTGFRRIKGPAGSGKSLVLAARAAELANEGKTVLVATFNITLLNYLRDLAVRCRRGRAIVDHITWLNFHQWCKRMVLAAGEHDSYRTLWKDEDQERDDVLNERDDVLQEKIAALVRELYQREGAALPKYDAILVDEGQDYRLSWWTALRAACKNDGEMLLVADPTQDLYGTARAWTERAMVGAGFSGGPWTTLEASYRLPPELIPLVRDFAERFLPEDELQTLPRPAQGELPLARTDLRWLQVTADRAENACVDEILNLPSSTGGSPLPWADITFLCSSKAFGANVVSRLEGHGVRVLHTFYDRSEERRRKLAFFKGGADSKSHNDPLLQRMGEQSSGRSPWRPFEQAVQGRCVCCFDEAQTPRRSLCVVGRVLVGRSCRVRGNLAIISHMARRSGGKECQAHLRHRGLNNEGLSSAYGARG